MSAGRTWTEGAPSEERRWTILHRRDWGHKHDHLVRAGAPVPEPDEDLEVITAVALDDVVEALRDVSPDPSHTAGWAAHFITERFGGAQ
jgi:hypothetical protein